MQSVDRSFYDANYYAQRHTAIDPYLKYILGHYLISENSEGYTLEAGCGSGIYIDFIRKEGRKAWGVDFSFDAARISGQINASALSLPFADNSFDVVLSIHMIEHLNIHDTDLFLNECRRVLKNKGKLFIMTPNALCPGRFILGDKWFSDPSHINIYNPFKLRRILRKNGFLKTKSIFTLDLNKINRTQADIVKYYGLDCIFKHLPLLQDLMFLLIFSTPLAFIRDVIYMRAESVK